MTKKANDRIEEIVKELNIEKLPFKIETHQLNDLGVDIADDLQKNFKGISVSTALKWCLSTVKKAKVFILVYQANERGHAIYKEEIAKKLPEYSYKTIASIIDEGIQKKFYVTLEPYENPQIKKNVDKKVKNIRPSTELIASFLNWNIDRIAAVNDIIKKYK